MSQTEVLSSSRLFQNTFILGKPRVANFADIVKNSSFLLKKPLKTQKYLKDLEFTH